MNVALIFLAVLCASTHAFAAPRLKAQSETLVEGALKAKVLEYSRGIPPPTPKAEMYTVGRGTGVSRLKVYDPFDFWRVRAEVGTWEDRYGNVMKLARVKSLVPEIAKMEATREALEKALDEAERDFAESEENLAAWKDAWGVKGTGRFVKPRGGGLYWVEFRFKEAVKDSDAQRLLVQFERSLVANSRGTAGAVKTMKWWEAKDGKYRFITNLHVSRGRKFINDSMRLMAALRKGFEYYVPPQKSPDLCTVRVFATLSEYREYRKSTGAEDMMSCGLWDPSRDELLIVAEDPVRAQETMRHESFHQYLHYATPGVEHAAWFNEGHATFFENIRHLQNKGTVAVLDSGLRAEWLDRDPVRYANLMKSTLGLSYSQFYSGAVNDHYVTAWAIVYFLERGAYTSPEFEAYRGICGKYLELIAGGASAAEATTQAWAAVSDRDLAQDFLKFWRTKRKASLVQRENLLLRERKSPR